MPFDFVVIGATGEQGSIASRDLLESGYRVLLCGRHPDTLTKLLRSKRARFANLALKDIRDTARVIQQSKSRIVVNCAELSWNYHAMEACLQAGVHYLDLGGLHEMTKKQYRLDSRFRKKNLIAVLGCGSTPGIANVMTAYALEGLSSIDHIDLGFAWDSNVKTFVLPYSLESIVYELTVPAVVLENGQFKTTRACTLEGITNFFKVGKQATYCIVHSEVYTFHRYFKNRGLRSVHYKAGFPAHSHGVLETLMNLGFASKEPLHSPGGDFVPLQSTNRVLRSLPRPKNYEEIEDLWVKVHGSHKGKPKRVEMDCIVNTTPGWSMAGSNVDTGRTISVMAQMLHRGEIKGKGVTAPEACVPPLPFFFFFERRGMRIYKNRRVLSLR